MKLKSILIFIFKKTPARLAFTITLLYGLLVALLFFFSKGNSDFYTIILLPVLIISIKFGCWEGFWISSGPNCIRSPILLSIIIFSIIFLFFWAILKSIFFLIKKTNEHNI